MAKSNRLTVVPATQEYIDALKGRFRKADDDECRATTGFPADVEVDKAFRCPGLCWVALVDGRPICAFGVAAKSVLCQTGVPWLLGTDDVLTNWVSVLKVSRKCVQDMLEPFDKLENFVDVRNTISIKWLKWCGFEMRTPIPYGILGLPFRPFYMTKGVFHV